MEWWKTQTVRDVISCVPHWEEVEGGFWVQGGNARRRLRKVSQRLSVDCLERVERWRVIET